MNIPDQSAGFVPVDFALQYIPDTPALHKAILRNQFLIPPLKDAICTKDFLVGVLEKKYWVPLTAEVQVRNCAEVPSKKELALALHELMRGCTSVNVEIRAAFLRTADLVLRHPPSQSWSLLMVSTVHPAHAIFAKDWQKPKAVPGAAAASAFIPSYAGFFEGLPVEQRTKRAGRINFTNKQQQQALRVQRLEDQLSKARANVAAEESKERSHASSHNVTAFDNPIQTVQTSSHIGAIVPVEYPLRPSMVATTATNIIGNAEDQEEVHAQSQPLHAGFPFGSRTPPRQNHMSKARNQRQRNAASAMDVQSAGYQANQHMVNEGVRRLQLGHDSDHPEME